MKWIRKIGILLFAVLLWTACNPDVNRHNALGVVSKADSLWHAGQMYGVDAGDSVTLAQTYETLSSFNSPLLSPFTFNLSSSYAHACYHYGKLLRAKDNPVEAMQAFINATHSGTDDYHILGRVYSNMGDMCHLAGDYDLSYDMFEKSANSFLQNGDTLLYYYDLANMAYETAEQVKKKEFYILADSIVRLSTDRELMALLYEAKALLYRKTCQYDSTLFFINKIQSLGRYSSSGYVAKAQAFWNLELQDSALHYANVVLNMPSATEFERYNMLYIRINGDRTLDNDTLLKLAAERSDLESEFVDPSHKNHALATTYLQRDIHKLPLYVYILAGVVLFGLFGVLWFVLLRTRKDKKQIQQTLLNTEEKHSLYVEQHTRDIEQGCKAIRSSENWQEEIYWRNFEKLCSYMDKHFFYLAHKLRNLNILNEKEIRLCIMVFIGGFSDKHMADVLCYGDKSIRTIKRNVSLKIGTTSANLRHFLIDLAIGNPLKKG